ncbi:hypothetical protein [Marichromatium gracile]|uniref:Uncharacterized protein n=1 Tax=Marichromatium gracile TaxID=1048 RepID=A0A4R4AH80_MARGR|nr:hypothetical protein [Marichromatium gracile]TCW38334.1 hypothetical protein EDC29_102226 [Marichromatium gracile]
MFEILPWILGVAAATHSIYKKDDTVFAVFAIFFLVSIFLYFAYSSVFLGVMVPDFLSILPFHLILLFFFCSAYYFKSFVKYEEFKENVESYYFQVGILITSVSFFIGAAFLGYYWPQYLTAFYFVIFLFGINFVKKYPRLSVVEFMSLLLIGGAIFSYYVLAMWYHGGITPKSIMDVVSRHMSFSLMAWFFFLYALVKMRILEKKQWDRFAAICMVAFIFGFSTLHPELKQLSSPVIKNIVDIAFIGGDVGVIGVYASALVKHRVSLLA